MIKPGPWVMVLGSLSESRAIGVIGRTSAEVMTMLGEKTWPTLIETPEFVVQHHLMDQDHVTILVHRDRVLPRTLR